jgi:hypothetical protein
LIYIVKLKYLGSRLGGSLPMNIVFL